MQRDHARRPRVLAVLALGTILTLAGLAGPASSAGVSSPSLALSPATATRGSVVAVHGSGFRANRTIHLTLDGSSAGMPSAKTSSTGAFSTSFTVPTTTILGSNAVSAYSTSSRLLATATLTVISSTTSPSSSPTRTPTPTPTPTPTLPTATPTPTPTPTLAPSASTGPNTAVPAFNHIYWIVMENHEYSSIVGSASAPYVNSLIAQYGLATAYDAVSHPSEPNYLALFSGSTQGVADDATHNLGAKNVADQLDAAGKSWHVYEQDYPGSCFTGTSYSGGIDLAGLAGSYVRKHDPAISFTDISGNATRCAKISDLALFDPAAANFEVVVPNLMNDMHDGTIAEGDSFLKAFVPRITSSPAFANSALFITWDEGTTNTGGGGHVATVVVAPGMPAGFKSSTPHNHYSLMRTVEAAWGLPCLANACSAAPMSEFPY